MMCTYHVLTVYCYLHVIQVCEDAKQYIMIMRALNYNLGLPDFTILFFCSLSLSCSVMEVLQPHCDFCQLAVCGMPSSKKGMVYYYFSCKNCVATYVHMYL